MAGMSVEDDDAGVVVEPPGPYFMSGTLKGHMWLSQSGAGTTLTTTGYDVVQVAGPVCITGSVAATPDYNSNASLGLNLNQGLNDVPMAFTPTLGGLQVGVANRGASPAPLRIQIQTQDGAGLWCAVVNGAGGFIAWTDFNTACWDGSGTAYARQPIATANLQVPGGTVAAIPYDVCLNSLAETAAPPVVPPPPVVGPPAPPT